jgi:glycerophosphoryl diester phosphodiesterase
MAEQPEPKSYVGHPTSSMHALSIEPRPFYVMGHNTNTMEEVRIALNAGANALEPDVNVYADDPSRLCISHGEGDEKAPALEDFLRDLCVLAQEEGPGSRLSLIVFDCKPKACTPEFGVILLRAIRACLTKETGIHIIISVADFDQCRLFDQIKEQLLEREGLSIDEEDDPIAVSAYFTEAGVQNQGYGNGISVGNPSLTAPELRPSMERVCAFRAATNHVRFVFAWTINDDALIREYLQIGVDGLITDDVADVLRIVQHNPTLVRMANRDDNPMRPANCAYSLSIHTGDVRMAGTNTRITFTLSGTNGTASFVLDASPVFRMERNDWNYVTLYSSDLGELQAITVQRDNQGYGADWYLDKIEVESFRFAASKQADFNCWIDSTEPYTKPLSEFKRTVGIG